MGRAAIRRFVWAGAIVLVAGVGAPRVTRGKGSDPFEFFAPSIVVSDAERQRLNRDEPIVRMLPGDKGHLGVFAATRLNAPPDALIAWAQDIVKLKQGRFVSAIGRFSDPPTPADLHELSLDERDVEDIRKCVAGDCALKLSAPEIECLRSASESAGTRWREAIQETFPQLVVARVNRYQTGGLGALPPIADRKRPTHLETTFSSILARSPYLERLPDVEKWLRTYPRANDTGIESFFYWSKEQYGRGKPVISVTHVGIVRPEQGRNLPAVLVVGKQILATHYSEGALGLTMVMTDAANDTSYLVYLNRSQLDVLRSSFAGLFRGVLEGRLEDDAPEVLRGLRARLESGPPPPGPPTTHSTPPDRERVTEESCMGLFRAE